MTKRLAKRSAASKKAWAVRKQMAAARAKQREVIEAKQKLRETPSGKFSEAA